MFSEIFFLFHFGHHALAGRTFYALKYANQHCDVIIASRDNNTFGIFITLFIMI